MLLVCAWTASAISSTGSVQGDYAPVPAISVVPEAAPPLISDEFVPQSEPTWIAIEPAVMGKTLLNPAGIRAVNGVVMPADNRPVFRTDSNLPGTDSPGTSFIIGHNYADLSGEAVPFSALEKVAPGNSIILGTPNGTLVYEVEQVLLVPKDEIALRTDLLVNVPGRLILETCDTTDEGLDTSDNLVVIAGLT